MEIRQFEPLGPFHQRTSKNTQTRPADSTHRELAPRPSLQAIQAIHKQNQPHSSVTKRLQPKKHQRTDPES